MWSSSPTRTRNSSFPKATGVVPPVYRQPTVWQRLADAFWTSRGLLAGVLAAVLGLAVLRHFALQGGRKGADAGPVAATGLRRPVPRAVAWTLRVVLYGVALVIALPLLLITLGWWSREASDVCDSLASACLDPATGLLKPQLPVRESGPPRIPCRYVGSWTSRQGGRISRILLKDDGTYDMAPNEAGMGSPTGYTGYWAVQGQYMVWRHNAGVTGPDVNKIIEPSPAGFTLVETSGKHTRYELIQQAQSTRCTP